MDKYGHLWTDKLSDQTVTRAIERSIMG